MVVQPMVVQPSSPMVVQSPMFFPDDDVPYLRPTPSSMTDLLHEQPGESPTDDYVPLVQPTPSSMTIFLHEQVTSETRALQGQEDFEFVDLEEQQ